MNLNSIFRRSFVKFFKLFKKGHDIGDLIYKKVRQKHKKACGYSVFYHSLATIYTMQSYSY
jgi:hypothetical protein